MEPVLVSDPIRIQGIRLKYYIHPNNKYASPHDIQVKIWQPYSLKINHYICPLSYQTQILNLSKFHLNLRPLPL